MTVTEYSDFQVRETNTKIEHIDQLYTMCDWIQGTLALDAWLVDQVADALKTSVVSNVII